MNSILAIFVGAGMIKSYQMVFETAKLLVESKNVHAISRLRYGAIIITAAGIVGLSIVLGICLSLGWIFLYVAGV